MGGDAKAGRFPAASPNGPNSAREGGSRPTEEEEPVAGRFLAASPNDPNSAREGGSRPTKEEEPVAGRFLAASPNDPGSAREGGSRPTEEEEPAAGRFLAASPNDPGSAREGGSRPTEEEGPAAGGEIGECLMNSDVRVGFDGAELTVSCPSRARALRLAWHEYSLNIVCRSSSIIVAVRPMLSKSRCFSAPRFIISEYN